MNRTQNRKQDRSRRPQQTRQSNATLQRQNGHENAHRNYERYLVLAREAAQAGDPIEAENCYQHAEHYFRVTRER